MDQLEPFPQLVGVLDSNDNFAMALATAALNEAGIMFEVIDIPDVPTGVIPANPKYWIPPCRILVAVEDASEARSLLESLQEGPISDDIEMESGSEKT